MYEFILTFKLTFILTSQKQKLMIDRTFSFKEHFYPVSFKKPI